MKPSPAVQDEHHSRHEKQTGVVGRAALVVASVLALALTAGLVASACGAGQQLDPQLGGDTTREDASRNSFGLPAPGLSNEERRAFEIGDSFFTKNWVTAPASTEARDGLGPVFNAQACSSCHGLDGRGFPPAAEGEPARLGLLLRLSVSGADPVTGGPVPEPTYGGQLQDRSVLDVAAEGSVAVEYVEVDGTYGDGEAYQLLHPTYSVADPAYGPLADDVAISPRLAPQVIGMGLLEAIPAESIMALADPEDLDGDGISGRPNMVWDGRTESLNLGRFGWKANVVTVEQQVAGAFHGDIGITSSLHPDDHCPAGAADCEQAPNGGQPELTDSRLASITFYGRTLSVPAMRDIETDAVQDGAELFADFGCSSCHTSTHVTGAADVASLANQTIYPYTDLLLHDMGEGLADDRPDFAATGSEWRTPPLWGLGLIDDVNGERFLLHDGRARTIEEAILWHGGEGKAAMDAFRTADPEDRAKLIAFLEAL